MHFVWMHQALLQNTRGTSYSPLAQVKYDVSSGLGCACLLVWIGKRKKTHTYSLPVWLVQPGFIMNCRCNILLLSGLQRLSKSRGQDQMAESNNARLVRKKGRSNQTLWCVYITLCLFIMVLLWVATCVKPAFGISILLWKLMNLRQNWKQDAVKHLHLNKLHFLA